MGNNNKNNNPRGRGEVKIIIIKTEGRMETKKKGVKKKAGDFF